MIDEFLWFSCPGISEGLSAKMDRLRYLIGLIVKFMSSPSFRWNAASASGRVHLGATIERLCKSSSELCQEVSVELPHFAIQTSEVFQEVYEDRQYSDYEYEENHAKLEKWWSQALNGDC